jgi:hypothetical protein
LIGSCAFNGAANPSTQTRRATRLPIEIRPRTFRQAAACTRFMMSYLTIDFLGTAG